MAKHTKHTTQRATEALVVPSSSQALPATSSEPMTRILDLASDPKFDVEKLRALIEMRDRELEKRAREAFNRAMVAAQEDIQAVPANAYNEQTKSRYPRYDALDKRIRPIYTRHGFACSFNTDKSDLPEHVLVLCDVSHREGYSRTYRIDMPADGKGPKGGDVMTKTHATASAVRYGMRYLMYAIWNIAVAIGQMDDDGNAAGGPAIPPPPGTITKAQADRLWSIARKAGRADADVVLWLRTVYKVGKTEEIPQTAYAAIIRTLEGREPLPMPGDGQ